MNYKKKSLILITFFILTIQILLLINNKQKTFFKYFIWEVEEVSIGRLICISFFSGLLMSSLLDKTIPSNIGSNQKNEEDTESTSEKDDLSNSEDKYDSNEAPPERDLRDTQPTISVNYRIVKDNSENEFNNKNQISKNPKYKDDWNNTDSEW